MIVDDGKLAVLNYFIPDDSLPKRKARHERERAKRRVTLNDSDESVSDQSITNGPDIGPPFRSNPMAIQRVGGGQLMARRSLSPWIQFINWLVPCLHPRHPDEPTGEMTVEQFFASVKNSTEELKVVAHRAAGFSSMIKRAQANGQTTLVENLVDGIDIFRAETQLLALEMKTVLREEQLVEFVLKSKRGLELDYLHRFKRLIPEEIAAKKLAADERQIFDNYVVLHYDPEKKASELTKAEKKAEELARRDPILFGLIEGSRKLYFVGDWVDELCDLTLEKIADVLGKDSIKTLEDGGGAP